MQLAENAYKDIKNGTVEDGRKKPETQVWRDESAAASKIEGQLINIIKNTKPQEKEKTPIS